jgi:glycine oxidase
MSVAWRLAQAGFGVTVHEKSTTGTEASWAAAGMLSPGGEFEDDSPLARMAVESRDLYRAFVEELQRTSGVEIDFQESGALELAYSSDEMTLLHERTRRQAAIGIPSKRVSPEQVAIFWPRLRREELAGGYFYPGDATVDPRHVTAALRICCERAGVCVAEHSEISLTTR